MDKMLRPGPGDSIDASIAYLPHCEGLDCLSQSRQIVCQGGIVYRSC